MRGSYRDATSTPCAGEGATCGQDATLIVVVTGDRAKLAARYCDRHGQAMAERMRGNGRTVTVKRLDGAR